MPIRRQQAEDVAAAIARLVREADQLDIDPGRIILSGHSAGAHLAALVGTDPRYLGAHRLPISILDGVVLLDGAGYDVPRQMQRGGPLLRRMYAAPSAAIPPSRPASRRPAGRRAQCRPLPDPPHRQPPRRQRRPVGSASPRPCAPPARPREVVAVDNSHAEIFRLFGSRAMSRPSGRTPSRGSVRP